MITYILLALILLAEVTRLVLTHLPTSKRQHFKQKLAGTQKMIWDLEFKVFKTREVREDIRKEYDQMKARIHNLEQQITQFPKEKDPAEKARLEDDKVRAEANRDRYERQMKMIDNEIDGLKPSSENPDGATGIMEQIDSLQELKGMLTDWLKRI